MKKYKSYPYASIRFPKEAYIALEEKKRKTEEQIRFLTGKSIRIWKTQLLKAIFAKPINFDNDELIKYFGRRK